MVAVAVAALALALVSVAPAASATAASDDESFYQPPSPLPRRPPGTIIRAVAVAAPSGDPSRAVFGALGGDEHAARPTAPRARAERRNARTNFFVTIPCAP